MLVCKVVIAIRGRAKKQPMKHIHAFAISTFFFSRLSDKMPAAIPEIIPIVERLRALSCEKTAFYAGKFFKKKMGT